MAAVISGLCLPFDGLFDWWVQELREARDAFAERCGTLRSPRFQLNVCADHLAMTRIAEPTGEQHTFKLDDGQLPPLEEAWKGERPRNARIELVLADADVLVFQLRLPPMATHELKDAVELQLERKLPLPREQLHVDWEVVQKDPDRSRTISVAVARRAKVEWWRECLRSWSWRLVRVSCRDLDGAVRFNLLPRSTQRVSFSFGRREALLAGSASGLAILYCLVTVGQWIYERRSLAADIERATAQVAGVNQLRATLERESKPLIEMRRLTLAPGAGNALLALSTTVPNDAWLYQTDIQALASAAPVITMEGYAPSAATLVRLFEQAQQFQGIQLIESSAAEPGLNRIKMKAQLQSSAAL